MASVWIPSPLQKYTGGERTVVVAGRTVRELIENLEHRYPGVKALIVEQDVLLRRGVAVVVDGNIVAKGLLHPVAPDSEVHFIPAIGGG
jgi:molybdopterin synthase sulfur carrier subunit